MRFLIPFFMIVLYNFPGFGQDAVHNYGNMQVHETGMMGFHIDVINNGAFNQNKGLVGFYSIAENLTLSGESNPIFYDLEVAVDDNLYIDNTIGVLNNANFITGNVVTNRVASEININFLNDSFYTGESSTTKVDGYSSVSNKSEFMFPIGQGTRLRPLTINSINPNVYVKSAYFYENPNSPSAFGTSFDTDALESEFLSVSRTEFWHLDGEVPSRVTLSWDEESNVDELAEYITDLKVVGWSVMEKQWVNLGNTQVDGDLTVGTITSEEFIPNAYEVVTLGGKSDILETFENIALDNYYMTPNGDGINDRLVIEGIENSPNNTMQIFNRYGVLVYSKQNYNNEFDGISNRESAILKGSGLASGIYFYLISLNDLQRKHQGYLYLTSYQKN